ncbi:aminotransferase-like domain-containing protein [Deminuibacter soli]|uniref:PLP-dependent aminotransferase family protein n=1 Tax=Deminuibacter soli TaxID=2291815 RepID=A0A3E1NKD2_9BACT|nr:PLP-dependent aminotransferase family protein [Deminuibacter soli]RFM28238.1 PLP-dependent aminotransferase family protein [Deminuibacter soli]
MCITTQIWLVLPYCNRYRICIFHYNRLEVIKTPAYIQLADKITLLINKGVYRQGDKLPSLRSIHRENGISIGTALEAFRHLLDKGLITAHEKSGYFVSDTSSNALPLPAVLPATLSQHSIHIYELIQRVRKEGTGKDFISFANALPDHRLLPFNGIKRAIQETSRDASGAYLALEAAKGNRQLRQAIAKRAFTWGGSLHMDDVIVTNGTMEAITLCLRTVTQPGDTVLIQSPCYYGIMEALEYLGLKAVSIPSHPETGIALPQLESACDRLNIKACLLVSNFNNPDGASLSTAAKQYIAAFAAKRKMPVIEDDIYGDLFFGTRRPDTIKTYDKHGWVMLCSSFSKSLFPGFRMGWCAPGRFAYEVERFKSMNNIASCNFSQRTLQLLLHGGTYNRHLQQFRTALQKNMLKTLQLVEKHFPEGTRATKPQGGLVLWLELPQHINAAALQEAALEKNVALAPGEIFSATGQYKHYIRLSYCNLWSAKTEKALIKLGQLCQGFAAKLGA